MKNRIRTGTILLLAAIFLTPGLAPGSPAEYGGRSGPLASITIGTTTSEVNSLIFLAQDQGYFTRNGLSVTHKIYSSGLAAVEGMLKYEVDIATGSEFAFAGKAFSRKDIRTFGVINRSSVEYLVGRADRKIKTVADLKGKRIGVPLLSRPEFSLDRFLNQRGIADSDVTLVNVPVHQSVDALASGKVDAVTAWQPYVNKMREQLGQGIVVWKTQDHQPSYTLLICTDRFASPQKPERITGLLKALLQAESYFINHPEAAKAIIQKKLLYDQAYMATVWPDYNFAVLLDQSLIVAMEDEARWMIGHKLTQEKQVPNFSDYLYENALKALKPEAVRIIR